MHNHWVKWKIDGGYVYGPVRNGKSIPPTHPLLLPWSKLGREIIISNWTRSDTFFRILEEFNYGIRKAISLEKAIKLPDHHIKVIARKDHERWLQEKRAEGWVYGPVTDFEKRIHKDLLEWEDLSERHFDRNLIEALYDIGYEVYQAAQ